MSGSEFDWYVGIDWGTAHHEIHITDGAGAVVATRRIEHSGTGMRQFLDWLTALCAERLPRVAAAIEVPRGAVVESLLERGVVVFSLNPKQLDRFRDRFSVAGAKDDRLDARVLASALRTDQPRFRRLAIDEPAVIQVRELTRAAAVLTEEFLALTNRLRELVHRIAPEWLTLSSNADDPWFWALLERATPPLEGRRLRRATVERLLQAYRIRRVTPDEVVDVLERPPLELAPGTGAAVRSHIALLLPRVRLVHEQRRACEHALERMLDDLTTSDGPADPRPPGRAGPSETRAPGDVAILRSTPGIGTLVMATLIAEANALLATRDYDALRAVTGVAPVRRQTGVNKRGTVSMRYACNPRLRNACYHWARVSTCVDAAARAYYSVLRARGHSHGRALRSVADRWLRILIAMLKARTLYDPTRLHDAQPLTPIS